MESRLRDSIRGALVAGVATSVAAPVLAQDKDAKELGKVQVTGSRISRTDLETSSPVLVVTREQIERTGLVGIGEILEELPIAGSGINTLFNNGGDGSTRLSLRNLGIKRTLVLVNGRRWVNSDTSVDLNTIPTSIIERVEILKDGASAIYGADAVAGVVNIITRRDYQGMEGNAQYGQYDENDGETQSYDLSVGAATATTSAFLNFSYIKQDEIWAGDRDISKEPIVGTGNTRGSGTSPQGRFYLLDAASSYLITTNPGSPQPSCPDPSSVAACLGTGDDGSFKNYTPQDAFNFAPDNYLLTPNERWNVYGQVSHAISDDISFVSEVLYHHRESSQLLAPTPLALWFTTATGPIAADNPYNPWGVDIGPLFSGTDIQFVGLQRRMKETVGRDFEQDVDMFRLAAGFEGSFDLFNRFFDWDVGAIYGERDQNQVTDGLLDVSKVRRATGPLADCVGAININPDGSWNGNGGPDGCVPFNWFGGQGVDGQGTIDQAQLDYVTFLAQDSFTSELRDVYANLSGELWELPAGPLGFAAGWEYREEKAKDIPDAIIATGLTSGNIRQPTEGSYDVTEFYGELNVPILADLPFAQTLELSAAARYSDYSSFGDETTWKFGAKWKPFNDLLIRGTRSEAYRAPNVVEAFQGQADDFVTVTDPCNDYLAGGNANIIANCQADGVPATYTQLFEQIRITVGGNPDVGPENSDNYTFGIVYTPSFLPNFALYVDWYKIEIDDAIEVAGAQNILNSCYDVDPANRAFCDLISRGPGGDVSDLRDITVNLGANNVEGIDFLVLYTFPETRFGEFKLAWDSSYLDTFEVDDGFGTTTEYQGENPGFFLGGAYPRWKSNLDINWAYGSWGATWSMRYIHHTDEGCSDRFDNNPTLSLVGLGLCSSEQVYYLNSSGGSNRLGSVTYHDLQVTYDTPWYNSRITVGVNNIGDKDPPPSFSAFANSFNPTLYEVPGRFPYARLSVQF